MPRTKTDYSKTIIYVIKCKDDNITEEYIGSTTNFIERKSKHKYTCNHENQINYNVKLYQSIREHGGWDNFDMILIEKKPCEDRLHAEKCERTYIED
jgi:hypothetical protein